jgi:hypothetical protein
MKRKNALSYAAMGVLMTFVGLVVVMVCAVFYDLDATYAIVSAAYFATCLTFMLLGIVVAIAGEDEALSEDEVDALIDDYDDDPYPDGRGGRI